MVKDGEVVANIELRLRDIRNFRFRARIDESGTIVESETVIFNRARTLSGTLWDTEISDGIFMRFVDPPPGVE